MSLIEMSFESGKAKSLNVFGEPLTLLFCPNHRFYRDGSCNTGIQDVGKHLVCAQMTTDFLAFSKAAGNDLSTDRLEYDFTGLQDGDWWCLCVLRWLEAHENKKHQK